MTKPIKQWRVGREFNRRLKKAFDAHGIEIPSPHRTLYMGNPKATPPMPLHVVFEDGVGKPGRSSASAGAERQLNQK